MVDGLDFLDFDNPVVNLFLSIDQDAMTMIFCLLQNLQDIQEVSQWKH